MHNVKSTGELPQCPGVPVLIDSGVRWSVVDLCVMDTICQKRLVPFKNKTTDTHHFLFFLESIDKAEGCSAANKDQQKAAVHKLRCLLNA